MIQSSVCIVAGWNHYATDSSGQPEAELNEAFYRMHLEQYGPYVPYA